MVAVGLLINLSHSDKVKKALAFQAVALMEGIEFFCFRFIDVDIEREKIIGTVYQGEWVQVEKDFPDVIINTLSARTKEHKKISKKLREKCLFSSHYVGHKMKVYKKILRDKTFASYLIPSASVPNSSRVLTFLEKEPRAVFKSYTGNRGKSILFLEKDGSTYIVKKGEEELRLNEDEFKNLVEPIIAKEKWLIQTYIQSRTKNGRAYDFRIHMQKNGEGEWELTLIYPRISSGKKLNSNISTGGTRGELISFLMEEFPNSWCLVKEKLENFAYEFTSHFEGLYKKPFDELGIDVGFDENGRLWLFEVNSRPGCKEREFEAAKKLIPYCRYLAMNN